MKHSILEASTDQLTRQMNDWTWVLESHWYIDSVVKVRPTESWLSLFRLDLDRLGFSRTILPCSNNVATFQNNKMSKSKATYLVLIAFYFLLWEVSFLLGKHIDYRRRKIPKQRIKYKFWILVCSLSKLFAGSSHSWVFVNYC